MDQCIVDGSKRKHKHSKDKKRRKLKSEKRKHARKEERLHKISTGSGERSAPDSSLHVTAKKAVEKRALDSSKESSERPFASVAKPTRYVCPRDHSTMFQMYIFKTSCSGQ